MFIVVGRISVGGSTKAGLHHSFAAASDRSISRMPTPSSSPPKLPNTGTGRLRGWVVAILNQLALPGLGTVMAGRRIGYAQLLLSIAGFVCINLFLVLALPDLSALVKEALRPSDDAFALINLLEKWKLRLALGFAGIVLFGIAWLWALGTSVNAVRGKDKTEHR